MPIKVVNRDHVSPFVIAFVPMSAIWKSVETYRARIVGYLKISYSQSALTR